MRPERAQFVNNTYRDLSMGVTMLRNNQTFVRGTLHKSFNVMSLDFNGESYQGIMGHTSEHLQYVTSQVKQSPENVINGKTLFNVSI